MRTYVNTLAGASAFGRTIPWQSAAPDDSDTESHESLDSGLADGFVQIARPVKKPTYGQFSYGAINFSGWMVSAAYGIASLYLADPSDIMGNIRYGISEQRSLLANRAGFKRAHEEHYYRFNLSAPPDQDETLNEALPWRNRAFKTYKLNEAEATPVTIRMAEHEIWSYDIPKPFRQEIDRNYDLFVIPGATGHEIENREGCGTVFGVALFPKYGASLRQVHISFRGTQGGVGIASALFKSSPDWITNTNCQQGPTLEFPGKIHQGFYLAFLSYIETIKHYFDEYKKEIGDLAFKHVKIHVSGHSLGAAMATLTAYFLKRYYNIHVQLYAYASPRIGDMVFTANYLHHFRAENVFSVYLDKDPVTFDQKMITGGYDIPPNAIDLLNIAPAFARYFGQALVMDSNRHYFESIRYLIHQLERLQTGDASMSYFPLIQEYSFTAPPYPASVIIEAFDEKTPVTRTSTNYKITITGKTHITHSACYVDPPFWKLRKFFEEYKGEFLSHQTRLVRFDVSGAPPTISGPKMPSPNVRPICETSFMSPEPRRITP